MTSASAWGRTPKSPFSTIAELLQTPPEGWFSALVAGTIHVDNWIDLAAVLVFLLLGCALLAARRWGEGLFVVLGANLSFGSGLLMSQRRYVWVLFPVFVLLGIWGDRPWLDRTIIVLSALGITPDNLIYRLGLLVQRIYDMGFGAVWLTPIVDNPDEAFTGGDPAVYGSMMRE